MDISAHLETTSRTFAVAIPLLGEPLATRVGVAYLLFRVADTFEDATEWDRDVRIQALRSFDRALASGGDVEKEVLASPPMADEATRALVGDLPALLATLRAFPEPARTIVTRHARKTATKMAQFVSRANEHGAITLASIEELRAYCYAVAGIVGEMLTELYVAEEPKLASAAHLLRELAPAYGEGLQLVNILKDAADDRAHGRVYLPEGIARSEIIELARRDLGAATTYVRTLERTGASRGVLAFDAFPLLLARATLDTLTDRGAGAKVERADVLRIVASVNDALDAGAPLPL